MPQLSPFRGLRYNPRTVTDAAAVLCPPYDVISAEQRAALARRDPRNAVHVELPMLGTDATEPRSPYRHAAQLFESWQSDATLIRDELPTIYAYEQAYATSAGAQPARGFFCLVQLESFGTGGGVRPHERTMAGPKEDRLRLLEAVRANLSPVIMLYETSQHRSSAALLDQLMQAPAEFAASADDGVMHRLWPVDPSGSAAAELLGLASAGPLTIADGHHRYETALQFRDEEWARTGPGGPADRVLALLYDARTGGLSVAPTHRLVLGAPVIDAIVAAARQYFALTPIGDLDQLLQFIAQPGRLGLWTSSGGALLEVRPEDAADLLPTDVSAALRWLDVTVLTSLLPAVVGCSAQELLDAGRLVYTKDVEEAAATVRNDPTAACFLLPPTPVEAVLEVAAAGEQMPPKSTYFQPKAATGLVFNSLAE